MAYSSAHILVRANGHFGTAAVASDYWSVGLRFGIPGTDVTYDEAKLQTFVQSCFAAASTFHADATSLVGTTCHLDNCSAARIGLNGKYNPGTQVTKFSTGGAVAGTGTVVLPWNSALVVSLRTPNPRGVASNGRCYWPFLAGAIQPATGRIASASVTNRMQNFKGMLNTMNTAANVYDPGMKVRVFSNVGLGSAATVTSLRADDRLDSIERRENNLPSIYVTTTVP